MPPEIILRFDLRVKLFLEGKHAPDSYIGPLDTNINASRLRYPSRAVTLIQWSSEYN